MVDVGHGAKSGAQLLERKRLLVRRRVPWNAPVQHVLVEMADAVVGSRFETRATRTCTSSAARWTPGMGTKFRRSRSSELCE